MAGGQEGNWESTTRIQNFDRQVIVAACRDPMSLPAPEIPFSEVIREGVLPLPTRAAYSKDLGGTCPVNPEVAAICEKGAQVFQALGASLANECPDLADAANIFQVSHCSHR